MGRLFGKGAILMSVSGLFDQQKKKKKKKPHTFFSLQVNGLTISEWSHSSSSLISFWLCILYSKLWNYLAYKRRAGLCTLGIKVVKAVL